MTCACVCARVRCSFNGRLGILERHGGNQNLPDMYAIMQGMALWLQSQEPHHFKVSTSFDALYASWSAAGILECCVPCRVQLGTRLAHFEGHYICWRYCLLSAHSP